MARLVETLNEMLGRIERVFEAQRRFTADASHELRSPLSRLRAELDVTLRRPRDRPEYEKALRSCLHEVEWLSGLTNALLTLARLDAGESPASGPVGSSTDPRQAVCRLAFGHPARRRRPRRRSGRPRSVRRVRRPQCRNVGQCRKFAAQADPVRSPEAGTAIVAIGFGPGIRQRAAAPMRRFYGRPARGR